VQQLLCSDQVSGLFVGMSRKEKLIAAVIGVFVFLNLPPLNFISLALWGDLYHEIAVALSKLWRE